MENHIIPHICTIESPVRLIVNDNIRFFTSQDFPQKYARKTNPVINPPVSPETTDNPLLKPVKTGNPNVPESIYTITTIAEFFFPRIKPHSDIAKVCIVIGTPDGRGNEIWDNIEISDTNIPLSAIFFEL